MGREVPRGGGDEPETNHPTSAVFTHLSFIPTLDARALASEGKFTETEENSSCTDLTPYHQPYLVCQSLRSIIKGKETKGALKCLLFHEQLSQCG